MFEELNTWISSLDLWQQYLCILLFIIFWFIVRWIITDTISDGVSKGIKKAHQELIDEYKNKMDKEEG